MADYYLEKNRRKRKNIRRKKKQREKIFLATFFCICMIVGFGLMVFAVKHAREFENVRDTKAAGLGDEKSTTKNVDDIDDDSWQMLMDDKVNDLLAQGYTEADAKKESKNWVAVPGTSEHHLGLAVDINSDVDINDPNASDQTEILYQWLKENAHRYGFILRYPPGKEDITGVNYEPWHYRYVGVENAEKIYESGLTLEEYLGN